MYLVYSEHPKTLVKTPRSLHKTYTEATRVLKEQVSDYITKYKGYQNVVFITSLDEEKDYVDAKLFVHINEEFSNRFIVYERKKVPDPGWLRTYEKFDMQELMMFSVLDLGTVLEDFNGENTVVNDTNDFVQKIKLQKNTSNGSQIKYIDELKDLLAKNRNKYFRE